ncbi:hypothetical protein [Kaarinaea lacus]
MTKYLYIILFVLCSVSTQADTLTGNYFSVKMEQPLDSPPEPSELECLYPAVDTQKIIKVFKAAVNRGELELFEQTITFSALKPQQVEYTYKVGEEKPTIKVYSLLNETIPLPAMPAMRVEAVTVTLDHKGRIIEAVVHVRH